MAVTVVGCFFSLSSTVFYSGTVFLPVGAILAEIVRFGLALIPVGGACWLVGWIMDGFDQPD
ncbi:MAG: hypothetical protein WA830_25810 [Candidatus Sulfotelmatobacter sp.]